MTEWTSLEVYLRGVCEPIMSDAGKAALRLTLHPDRPIKGDHLVLIMVPNSDMGVMIGRGGKLADALRALTKARMRAIGWKGRIDLRVISTESKDIPRRV